MREEAVRAMLVGAGFLLIFAVAEAWKRRLAPPVEWTRKFVHFAGGLLVASFPWVFASQWTVLALAAAFAGIIGFSRRLRLLGSVHGVERRSEGALYYPVAIYLLFLLSRQQPVLYLISVLTLVISDALAAVLGSAYGRWKYRVETEQKSLEGSVVFFLTTFLLVQVPLLLLTPIDRGASVLIGAQVALLVTCFEAISLRGSDNLIVPLGTYYLLVKMTPRSAEWIGVLLLAHLGIIGLTGLLAWRTHLLTFSGAVAAQLVLYGALSLGGPRWALAMALALAGWVALEWISSPATDVRAPLASPSPVASRPPAVRASDGAARPLAAGGGYQVLAVFYVSLVAALLLLLSNTLSTLLPTPALFRKGDPFYVPFVGALSAQLATLACQRLERRCGKQRRPAAGRVLTAAGGSFLVVAPVSLWVGLGHLTGTELGIAAAITLGATVVYSAGHQWLRRPWDVARALQRQAATVAVVTAAALPVYLRWLGVIK